MLRFCAMLAMESLIFSKIFLPVISVIFKSFKLLFLVYKALTLILRPICKIFTNDSLCTYAFKYFCPVFYKNFAPRFFNSEVLCSRIHFCKYPIIKHDSNEDFRKKVLSDLPNVKRPVSISNEVINFVAFADPHVDFHYQEVYVKFV
jgi:hypothetical protein